MLKLSKKIKFEGAWGELETKNCFQRQPRPKNLRKNSFSCEITQYRRGSISIFMESFASIGEIFFFGWRTGYWAIIIPSSFNFI